jgi:hypothetical protein
MVFRPIFGPRRPRCRGFQATESLGGADVSPILNPPTFRAGVDVAVRHLAQNLSGTEGTTRSRADVGIAFEFNGAR